MIDPKTLNYYNSHGEELIKKYDIVVHSLHQYFEKEKEIIPKGSRILDIGSGSGRDLNLLIQKGYDAYGIEPSDKFRTLSENKYNSLKNKIFTGSIPNEIPEEIKKIKFDGILCISVFMHIPPDQIFDSIFKIRELLEYGGKFILSIPYKYDIPLKENRDSFERLFYLHNPEYLSLLIERTGFKLVSSQISEDSLNRKEIQWKVFVFQLERENYIRPLDQIEIILNKDKKTATYKLALIRAFTDIAQNSFNSVEWIDSNFVGVPMDLVIEKWIEYYWFIFSSNEFIPQLIGEEEVEFGKKV
ncbi:MAG TPA: class I SAM-dependent methyltransferase [Leptospiraceae bacterium]|nr:class I SAM-dependent methyltransferase [Leptospiraceae bacterium]